MKFLEPIGVGPSERKLDKTKSNLRRGNSTFQYPCASMKHLRVWLWECLVALTATTFIAVLRSVVLVPVLGITAPVMPFLLAVLAAARTAGTRAGLFATALGLAFATYLRGFDLSSRNFQLRLALFVLMATVISWLMGFLRSTNVRMAEKQRNLEQEIQRREQAEVLLRAQGERIRLAVDSAAIGTWDFDPKTNELAWSDRSKAIFGLSPNTAIDTDLFRELLHPEDRERAYQAMQNALDPRGNGAYEIEFRIMHSNGTIRWVHAKGQTLFEGNDADRQASRFVGIVLDTTERKQNEMILRQAEEKFRLVATHAPVGIFETDAQGRCQFVNQAWCEIAGAKPEDALADGWQGFLHPDDYQRVVNEWQEAARHRRNHVSEFRFLRNGNETRSVIASAATVLDCVGAVSRYVGTTVDVTERKRAEDVVRASEARLQAILNNASAVIYLKDWQGRYLMVNKHFEALFKITQQQIAGKTDADLFPPDVATQLQINDRQVQKTGKSMEFEEVVPQDDGPHTYVSVKFPIYDPAGQCSAVGSISTDISDRKKALEALATKQDMLKHTIAVLDEERQLVAYQIHDGLVQYAAGALMQAEGLRNQVTSSPIAQQLEQISKVLQKTVAEGRRLINGIRTPVLDDWGIVAAVEQLIDEEDRATC